MLKSTFEMEKEILDAPDAKMSKPDQSILNPTAYTGKIRAVLSLQTNHNIKDFNRSAAKFYRLQALLFWGKCMSVSC